MSGRRRIVRGAGLVTGDWVTSGSIVSWYFVSWYFGVSRFGVQLDFEYGSPRFNFLDLVKAAAAATWTDLASPLPVSG